MLPPDESLLARAAIASRLVTHDQLRDALQAIAQTPAEGEPPVNGEEFLGHRLVEMQLLNPWQVEQLRAGRTKFTLGPYQIFDAIGKGGMGHVFKAKHPMLGRIEAIKVLPRHRINPDTVVGFLHEIRTQAQLDHPNLVRISYADREAETYYFVTEFIPGSDLRRLVRTVGPLTVGAAALVVKQAAEGLEHAHRRGLVHRDIKPGNLLVTPEGRVKVIDLGLAWYLEADLPEAQELDRLKIVGTADYLAPETIRYPDRVVPVSDIYALGCTLYYAVTGKVPFPGGNPVQKMTRHQRELPLPPQQLNPTLPLEFVAIIDHMMAKDHAHRVHSAAAVVELLTPWIDTQAPRQLAEAVASATAHKRTLRSSTPAADAPPAPRVDETLIYGEDEEAAIRGLAPTLPAPASVQVAAAPLAAPTAESREIAVEDDPPPEPADRLDQAVKVSIGMAVLVVLALVIVVVAEWWGFSVPLP